MVSFYLKDLHVTLSLFESFAVYLMTSKYVCLPNYRFLAVFSVSLATFVTEFFGFVF